MNSNLQEDFSKIGYQLDRDKAQSSFIIGFRGKKRKTQEKKEWEKLEASVGFYPEDGIPFEVPWDAREATRAMHELQISE